ncbi:DUF1853 family protein [Noviherbaspirillum aridicola]|uniref:DUF1853 family protein n=1 Tax=Noviherbaspirillum aridicola TaxID=2849687 RepID=A0ABQ4Q2U4_9BURK|nr:DUF1853 family protein [Noviherbaspirillum aridicola]GIZ51507.1 hypothetical protein NCCP691_15210 [Noviherbaspirillum aridicola]
MPPPTEAQTGYQAGFHRRWHWLHDRHVRDLAWLLDAPNLLDAAAPRWQGRIASLPQADEATRTWLGAQDQSPHALHEFLDIQPFTRLGRYAEKLLAWYLQHRDDLYAHGVQVRAGQGETIGEFDFLLRRGDALVHWEFATKLYLLESGGHGRHADYFVGPGLADTLGAKVRKIMEQQLALSAHPAARLPLPVVQAQALVKGWLFYEECTPECPPGIATGHCRGFWRPLAHVAALRADAFMVLPRLRWLAPARVEEGDAVFPDAGALAANLGALFGASSAPVLVALLRREGADLLEADRGFIVPDDWRERAAARREAP